jgi:hypothetical protein
MTTKLQQEPVDGTVEFIQHVLPGLDAGAYMLTVAETVSTQTDAPANNYFFAVTGARFALDPADLYATYPPNMAEGEFNGTLPHVVLTNRTLPWQRFPTLVEPPRFYPDNLHDRDVPTWLAVLLFDAGDEAAFPGFRAQAVPGKVQDLFLARTAGAAAQGYSYFWRDGAVGPDSPNLEKYLEYGESAQDPCQLLDVPLELFWKVAPSVDDLSMMAHLRNVSIVRKATQNGVPAGRPNLSGVPGTSNFALTMGNRMPQPGVRCFAHLVSLEGMAPFLPIDPATGSDPAEVTRPTAVPGTGGFAIDPKGHVRLVSLTSWSFTSTGDSSHFEHILQALQPKTAGAMPDYSIGLPLPPPVAGEPPAAATGRKALSLGYTALRHLTRDGGKTVSWYRGPLTPAPVAQGLLPAVLPSADAATLYDATTGIFDISYAAAWQMGRVLAVEDRRFSTLLVNWRAQNLADVATTMEQLVVSQTLDALQQQLRDDGLIYPLLQAFAPPAPPAALSSLKRNAANLTNDRALRSSLFASVVKSATTLAAVLSDSLSVPLEIYKWLAQLKLLDGVPFRYLIADEAMLPPESLRIFHLDINWVDAMLDGALSVGRHGTSASPATTHDHATRALVQRTATADARLARTSALGIAAPQAAPQPLETVTGFLLRSELVKGWPGLEVDGYAADGSLLDIIRFERLAPTVLLCLFEKDGKTLTKLDIHEPPEGLHFGLSGDGQAVNIRWNHAQGGQGAGTQVPKVLLAVPFRETGAEARTIRMFRLSRAMLGKDFSTYITGVDADFDHLPSSQFAMQMLRGVGLVAFAAGGSTS